MRECRECMWWVGHREGSPGAWGECRRRAPLHSGWPLTFSDQGCGEWELETGR